MIVGVLVGRLTLMVHRSGEECSLPQRFVPLRLGWLR